MFGSRRYRSPNQLNSATADPNATTAAAAVFKRQESNPSLLSAAAAAAALQAFPTAPTRVADVQTKRTLRRSASVASTATGASDTYGRPNLRRRGSSGSMTERTFRTPSPHRPGSSGPGQRHSVDNMPPVPALPKDVGTTGQQPFGGDGQQPLVPSKSTSLGMSTPGLRLASQRLTGDDAPSWFGAAKMGDPGNVRRTDPAMASPPSSPPQQSLDQSPVDGGRPSSRTSSINFSYPARVRVGSPTGSPVESRPPVEMAIHGTQNQPRAEGHQQSHTQSSKRNLSEPAVSPPRRRAASSSSDQTLVYDPNSRRMVRRADLLAVEQAVFDASQKRAKTRRKKQTSHSVGSHLAQGTMGRTRSIGSRPDKSPEKRTAPPLQVQPPVQPNPRREVQEDIEEPAVKAMIASPRIEAKRIEQQRAHDRATQSNIAEGIEPTDAVMLPGPQILVKRKPSIVKEEPEPGDREPATVRERTVSEALDSVPTRQRIYEPEYSRVRLDSKGQTGNQPPPALEPSPELPKGGQDQGAAHTVTDAQDFASHSLVEPGTHAPAKTSNDMRDRTQSISPPRQARFGPIHNNLKVIHSPPPRSVSPRKSALKHASPSRGASPSDDVSDASMSTSQREEQAPARKKSVRVSFDDDNTVVVGQSASTNETDSPVIASPQTRSPWFSSIGRSKKDLALLDDDEVMKPRPALPSFGSVRDKKPRELSPVEVERPLVRPIPEPSYSPLSTESPSLAPSPSSTPGEGSRVDISSLGQSSDHVVGAILGKELEERQKSPANTSRFREPLPPVVTTVEGSGYLSDSSSSSSSALEESEASYENPRITEPHYPAPEPKVAVVSTAPGSLTTIEAIKDEGLPRAVDIPSISISQPSPGLPDIKASDKYFIDLPGGFPEDDSDLSTADGSKTPIPAAPKAVSTPSPASVAQPPTTSPPPQSLSVSQSASLKPDEPLSDSESSIYSDAYEDLSEFEGDGFLSLNAVLESPPAASTEVALSPKETTAEKEKVKKPLAPKLEPQLSVATTVVDSHPANVEQDDWEKAKAYWRTLTADKRARLEKEALEEAGVDGDLEEVKPVQKPKKKKSVERRNSERKALAVHLAQQMIAKQQRERPPSSERNYMIKPGTKWTPTEYAAPAMRTTLRGETRQEQVAPRHDDVPHLRKSMRSGSSVQSEAKAKASVSKQGREASLPTPVPVPQPQPTATGRRQIVSGTNKQLGKTSGLSPIKRRGSSSSESSFKRARPGSSSQQQGFAFRTSMRQTSPTPLPSGERQAKRFSLRSLSPTGSSSHPKPEYPPISLGASGPMRRTLRSSSDERKSPAKVHMPSFGLSGSKKSAGKRSSKSKFSSRFGNSSDEDDVGGAAGFRSRFEDSSDDDVVAPMPLPVPLPKASRTSAAPAPAPASTGRHLRNQNSIASTALPEELEESEELPDSSDNEKGEKVAEASSKVSATGPTPAVPLTLSRTASGGQDPDMRRSRSGRGGLIVTTSKTAPVIGGAPAAPVTLTTGRPQPSSSKRHSFMSVLKRKKHTPSSGGAGDKISRPGITESAARRDTKFERSVGQLRGIRSRNDMGVDEEGDGEGEDADGVQGAQQEDPQSPASPLSPPKSPKLQKRILSVSRSAGTGTGTTTVMDISPGDFDPAAAQKETSPFGMGALRRPATSGNLGTRTLSGGSVTSQQQQQPAFLQNRTVSSGVLSLDGLGGSTTVGTPQKKKKFGALRRMFGLND